MPAVPVRRVPPPVGAPRAGYAGGSPTPRRGADAAAGSCPGYHSDVSSALRRLAALFSGVMMLVLLLTESGFACAMPDMSSSADAGAETSAMAGMDDMAGMPGMGDMAAPEGTAPAQSEDESPCRFPWAPSGCRDMAPCAPAALAEAAWQPEAAASDRGVQGARVVLTPPSFGTAPELPPPRA